jgi:hypothetical protein
MFQRLFFSWSVSFSIVRPLPPAMLLADTERRPEKFSQYSGMLH